MEVNFSISILRAFVYCLVVSHITVEKSKAILISDPCFICLFVRLFVLLAPLVACRFFFYVPTDLKFHNGVCAL